MAESHSTPLVQAYQRMMERLKERLEELEQAEQAAFPQLSASIEHVAEKAVELGEHGIRANCVAPGPVRTKLAMAVHSPEIIAAYHDAIPLNRYGSEDEIAEVIHFLCSPRASYVTGQTIAVDGGFEATGIGLPALRS